MATQKENIFIILDYLLTHTDETHFTSEDRINNFALDNYGVPIDHRSVCDLLKWLKDECDQFPDRFPFVLETNGSTERPKYHITKKFISKEDAIAITSAIKDTFQIDERTSKDLIEKFVGFTTSVFEKDEIINLINNQNSNGGKIKEETYKAVNTINDAIASKSRIFYIVKTSEDKRERVNYFFKIMYVGTNPVAIIINDEGKLVSYYVKDLKILRKEESFHDDPRDKFQYKNVYGGEYKTPEKEIEENKIPACSMLGIVNCTFEFDNDSYKLEHIKKSFYEFFHHELVYKEKNGKIVGFIKYKGELFIEWVTRSDIATIVTVTGSKELVDALKRHYQGMLTYYNRLS